MTGCLKGDHQYGALRRQEVVRWANHVKNPDYEEKGLINSFKIQIFFFLRKEEGFWEGYGSLVEAI
jgi:hypothetical protein